jgi:DNA-binding transcriptional LysR family regulator
MRRQLNRLREALGDELLLRSGRSHERTARGEHLLRELEPLLPRIEAILQGHSFDPGTSQDQFQVTMTDYACMVLLPELVKRTTQLAPKCSIDVHGWNERSFDDLRSGRIDTVITVAGLSVPQGIHCKTVFSDVFACVVAINHPLKVRTVSLAQYLKYRHVVIAVIGGLQPLVDRPLSDLSIRREIGLALPFFSPAISAVANTDMVLTVPRRLALAFTQSASVRWMAAPPEIRGFNYDMMWHQRLDDDPAHGWFRNLLRSLGQQMMKAPFVQRRR